MESYFDGLVKQTKLLTEELKKRDDSHHSTLNPISVYGELPINLFHQHNLVELFNEW